MRPQTKEKIQKARGLIEDGKTLAEALKETSLSANAWYASRSKTRAFKKAKAGTKVIRRPRHVSASENDLSARVLRANLPDQMKVEILTAIL